MHIAHNKVLRIVFRPLIWLTKCVGEHHPTLLVKIRYYVRFHKRLDIEKPSTLNEKILFLSLKTDTTKWTSLADKYEVRGYVEECGLGSILTRLYAHWNSEIEVNFDNLPDQFVIKSVQGSGDVIIVHDKSQLDRVKVMKLIHIMLNDRFGALEGGKHYLRINPSVIVEELLPVTSENANSLIDYKIWCFNGKPEFIMTCSSRTADSVCLGLYDKDWNYHPEYMVFSNDYQEEKTLIAKPENLETMLQYASILASGFPVVRVDLYDIQNKIYFGEMTFTSLGGLMDYYSEGFQKLAGEMIDISQIPTIK